MINLEGDQDTRQDSREERIQGAMYISPERTRWSHRESKNPSHPPFTYSMRYFKIPRSSLSPPMSILLYTLGRTARIVGSPGPPRVAIRGHRRLQPASKSGSSPSRSVSPAPSSLSLQLASSETKSEEHGQRKEKRGDVCASIYDVRWIGARASTLVTILMRLLYDVTFNGAPMAPSERP